MMKRRSVAACLSVAFLATLIALLAEAWPHFATPAEAASPTPAVATAVPAVPVAPTNLRLTGEAEGLVWVDNSTDETGFEVTATDRGSGAIQTFSLPANTTSFQLPPSARASCTEPMSYAVVAVNAVGASEQARVAIRSDCLLPVSADAMVVSGVAPVSPGSAIVIEALDAAAIRGVECARGQTGEMGTADPPSSRFGLTVKRDCVQRASGNLRVCWGEGKCQGFEFQPGQRLELGVIVLRTPIASAPDVGFGPDARGGSGTGDNSIRTLAAAGLALVGVGALLFAGSLLARVRRRYGRSRY